MTPWGDRRPIAVVVIALGLCTFFLPILILPTPVLGRTKWSPFDVATEVHNGRLPAARHWIDLPVVEDAVVYLLFVFALLTLALPRGRNVLQALSVAGVIISALATRSGTRNFTDFVTGSSKLYWQGGAKFGPAMYLLPLTMLALWLVSRHSRTASS